MILMQATDKSVVTPRWMEDWQHRDGVTFERVDRMDGVLHCLHGPYEQVPTDLTEFEWVDVPGEFWKVAIVGKWHPFWLCRNRSDLKISIVLDSEERQWKIVNSMMPYPSPQARLKIPLGANWAPKPHTWQESLINIAKWIREEVETSMQDSDSQSMDLDEEKPLNEELFLVPIDATKVLDAAAEVLSATYHVHVPFIQALGLLDDYFAGSILRDNAGYQQDSMDAAATALGI